MRGKPSVLITGGFGNLGSWLSEYYFLKGYKVTILASRVRTLNDLKYEVIQVDISDLEALKSKLINNYDYCIHTASYNEHFHDDYAKKALMINALGTRNLIEVLKDKDIKKFIYFSTFHVYGNSYSYIDEDTKPSPINDYATTHLFAEYYLAQFYNTHQFPYLTVRLTNSYGAPKHYDSTKWYLVFNDLVKSAFENKKIVLQSNGKATRDFIWMGDVCTATETLLHIKENNNIYNLSSGQSYKIIDLAIMVQKVFQRRYDELLDIVINQSDCKQYSDITVSNSKLLETLNGLAFSNKFEEEIEKIFTLLESKYE